MYRIGWFGLVDIVAYKVRKFSVVASSGGGWIMATLAFIFGPNLSAKTYMQDVLRPIAEPLEIFTYYMLT